MSWCSDGSFCFVFLASESQPLDCVLLYSYFIHSFTFYIILPPSSFLSCLFLFFPISSNLFIYFFILHLPLPFLHLIIPSLFFLLIFFFFLFLRSIPHLNFLAYFLPPFFSSASFPKPSTTLLPRMPSFNTSYFHLHIVPSSLAHCCLLFLAAAVLGSYKRKHFCIEQRRLPALLCFPVYHERVCEAS